MDADFSRTVYHGYIIKGDLNGAINYVKQFPAQAELYHRYIAVFEQQQYTVYAVDADLNEILTAYQRYYRDAFYLCISRERAADKLRARLADCLGIDDRIALCDMEQNQIAEAFRRRRFYFMGGMTSGYYGPYIWRTTEQKTYEVELPDGVQTYVVKLLDGFVARSWIDYLSFGEIGPGGWSNGDGTISCVKSAYDFDSEPFKVSLLKHEAQHARDLAINPNMSSEELEYRAKLVELIYSSERNLLEQFIREADSSDRSNGHASASSRIVDGFAQKLSMSPTEMERLPNSRIQATASILFAESNRSAAELPQKDPYHTGSSAIGDGVDQA